MSQSKKKQDLMSTALSQFETIQTAESHIRDAAIEDIKFAYNIEEGQWPADIKEKRDTAKRPCITSNKLRKFVGQVSNRQRDNRLVGKAVPVDSGADVVKALIYDDIIRQIQHDSKAEEIYTEAGENAIAGGMGYWRVLTEFVKDGFDQEITIKLIENPFSVYFDPRGNYCFIREGMTKDEFKEKYPDSEAHDFEGLSSKGEKYSMWYEDEKVFVAEYFYKKPFKKELAQVVTPEVPTPEGIMTGGETLVIEITEEVTIQSLVKQGYNIIRTRKADSHKIMWAKMTGLEVLEEKELDGQFIPVIEVVGDKVNVEGKIYKRSLIRDGKDPQRMYNYWLTSLTESIALAPKVPFIATAEQIEGYTEMWDEANVEDRSVLLYNDNGRTAVPQRQPSAQLPSGAASMLEISDRDIQDTIGMFDASFGQASNERSKVAIDARSQRSDLGTFHFIDNLNRAILHTMRIVIDLIPYVYDTERILRIRGKDGGEDQEITINQAVFNGETGKIEIMHDLTVGKYDIQEDLRSSFTKRQETVQFMLQALQYAPEAQLVIIEALFRQQDWDGSDKIADEIKQIIDANKQQTQPGETQTTPPPEGEGL